MKTIKFDHIRDTVAVMCQKANTEMTDDVRNALVAGSDIETKSLPRRTLLHILNNADIAKEQQLPMCQDTGLVVVFVDVGQDVHISGGLLEDAINAGVRKGYQEGFLRASVSPDPILRGNTGDNTPAVIHTRLARGEQLRLQLLAKGGGCENMSRFTMLKPTDEKKNIVDFVIETVKLAGPNACPPMIVGVGIGGSFEQSAVLAKRALLRRVSDRSTLPHIAELENELLNAINSTGIGPQGFGGITTALAVQIEVFACHIASLPVSVNIECHAHRHQEVVL